METVGNPASFFHILHQCFIYIQQARAFEEEFGLYQLQLEVHLSRCATVARSIYDTTDADDVLATHGIACLQRASEDQEARIAEILSAIQSRLHKAQQEAAKIEADLLRFCPPRGVNGKSMRIRMTGYLNERKVQAAKTIEGLKWALYKKNKHDKFIADISALIKHLERRINANNESLLLGSSPIIYVHTR